MPCFMGSAGCPQAGDAEQKHFTVDTLECPDQKIRSATTVEIVEQCRDSDCLATLVKKCRGNSFCVPKPTRTAHGRLTATVGFGSYL